MATLVLSVVGNILGGPVGGAIGAIIGQQIDQQIFATHHQGPRLNDLSVQTSAYGTKIPKLFGANRVAGSVIWSTDLQQAANNSGGKGSTTTTYSYSASLAVLISARPILNVGRIWADGNLLRGAGGDFKTHTGFRLYLGGEAQPVDPLIASAEGAGLTPAYRGSAYAVFESLQLANYGNRIPSLSFEVFADGSDVPLQQIVTELSGPGVVANCPTRFGGFAASGTDVNGAISTLIAAVPISLSDDGARLNISEAAAITTPVGYDDLGTTADRTKAQRLTIAHDSASKIAGSLALNYYDFSRAYQQSTQRGRRPGGARKEDRLDLPVTLDANSAKTLVETRLNRTWAERVTAKIALPWRYLGLQTGQLVTVPGNADLWRISAIAFNRMVLECDLVRSINVIPLTLIADAGRSLAQEDLAAGATALAVLDLPLLTDGVASTPLVYVAAAGVSPGWKTAQLTQSIDNGQSFQTAGRTAAAAILGTTTTQLNAGTSNYFDMINTVIVSLLNSKMALVSANDDMLLGGANLALINGELVQFGIATPLNSTTWQLSRLLRGRRGTEDQIGNHGPGDNFVLVNPATLAQLSVPLGVTKLKIIAQGVGDTIVQPEADAANPGLSLRPPSPVYLTSTLQATGDQLITWIRRSRDGWRWVDNVDAPLAEQQELYLVTMTPSSGLARSIQVNTATFIYTAAQQLADKSAGAASLMVGVSQIGTAQTSLPTSLSITLR